MMQVCREITDYIRACEHLFCKEEMLTEDERQLIEYYVKELSEKFLTASKVHDNA